MSYLPVAPAARLNTYEPGAQRFPRGVVGPDGVSTLVWQDSSLDSQGWGIYARRLNTLGEPLAAQFRVNTQFEGDQHSADIGADAAGNFVVAWEDSFAVGQYSGANNVVIQRYAADGTKIGTNTLLTDYDGAGGTAGNRDPRVLVQANGAFTVAWNDAWLPGIRGRTFNASSQQTASFDVVVERESWSHTLDPKRIAQSSDGTILVPWFEYRGAAVPDVGYLFEGNAWVRRLDAQGRPLGPDLLLASLTGQEDYAPVSNFNPAVTPLPGGGFVATWYDASGSFLGRRYSSSGSPLGTPLTLIESSYGEAYGFTNSALAAAGPDGNSLLVTWVNSIPFDSDTSYLRSVPLDGTAASAPTLLEDAQGYYQTPLQILARAEGLLLFWNDQGSVGNNDGDVYTQAFSTVVNRGIIEFATATIRRSEIEPYVDVLVTRTGDTSGPATVAYQTIEGSATSYWDFEPSEGTLRFAIGETSKTIRIPLYDDYDVESLETFQVRLSSPVGTVLGRATTEIQIEDNENAGVVRFELASASVSESHGTYAIKVIRVGGSDGDLTFQIHESGTASSPGDLQLYIQSFPFTFSEGETEKLIFVDIVDDRLVESSETLIVSLSSANPAFLGTPSSFVLTILDNDNGGGGGVGGGGGGGEPEPVVAPRNGSLRLQRGAISALFIDFDGPLNAASARTLANYQWVSAGRDGRLGTRDDKVIRLRSATYDARTRRVTLTPRSRPTLGNNLFRLVVRNLVDANRALFDGDRDGLAGGTLTAEFDRRGLRLR